jgi:hypothetical protein
MPAYLIVHTERRGDDTVIEDPDLTVEFGDTWVLFHTQSQPEGRALYGEQHVVLAVPVAQVHRVERVDEDQDPEPLEPAPQKE